MFYTAKPLCALCASALKILIPLYTFYIFYTAIPSASLRLCVKISQSPYLSIRQSSNHTTLPLWYNCIL